MALFRKSSGQVTAFGLSDIGGKKNNEDRFLLWDSRDKTARTIASGLLFAVADGMGGHRGGERASEIAVDTLSEYYSALHQITCTEDVLELLAAHFNKANEIIFSEGNARSEYYGMGSTLTALVLWKGHYCFCHAGDSCLYVYREQTLQRLTEVHTVTGQLVALGQISAEEAKTLPSRHELLKFLGTEKRVLPQRQSGRTHLGDRFVLCSDGLTDVLTDGEIALILSENGKPKRACKALTEAATAAGREGKDNITAVVVQT